MTKLTTVLLTPSLAVALSLLAAEVSLAQEIVDAGTPFHFVSGGGFDNPSGFNPYTQRFDMHACPPNWYMSAVHVDNNWFLCVSFIESTTNQPITYIPGYEANSAEQQDP